MPGNISGQTAVFVEHSQAACVVKTGRTHSRALAPRTELIERTLAADEECEIAGCSGRRIMDTTSSHITPGRHRIRPWSRP